MRVLPVLFSVLLLQGCLATENLQRQTLQAVQGNASQCETLAQQVARVHDAQDAVSAELGRQQQILAEVAEKVRPRPAPKAVPQRCADIPRLLKNKRVVGEVEWALIDYGDHQRAAKARMDTGATTSSISARNITDFERNGERWVRFTLEDGTEISKPLARLAKISQAAVKAERRRVIELGIRLGDIAQKAEFTLKDRAHLRYELLIGRNLLRDLMVVDVANRYLLGDQPAVPGEE